MSVLPNANNWTPSKEFMSAIHDVYTSGQPIDLTKFSAEDWNKAVAYTEWAAKLLIKNVPIDHRQPEVAQFIFELSDHGVNINLESLCSFGDLSFIIATNIIPIGKLSGAVNFIIENNVAINKPTNFQDILEPFSQEYFENWQNGVSIDAGALLVSLCDYLGVKVEPIAESPEEWDIEEDEFASYADEETKDNLKKFARLFSKPMKKWYLKDEWWD